MDYVGSSGRLFITAEEQKACVQELHKNLGSLGDSAVYGIGSAPTENGSYHFAVDLCRKYADLVFQHRGVPKIKWLDMGMPDWSFLKTTEDNEIIVIHGLSDNSEPKRFELAKDFARHSSDCTILILATTSNILDIVIRRLGLAPSAVWQLSTVKTNIVL
jgi:hypothetical protein